MKSWWWLLLVSFGLWSLQIGQSKHHHHNLRSYARCFGTSRFLFVGFANCHITTERAPPPAKCPYHAFYQASTYSQSQLNCDRAQMHLLIGDNQQPRVVILGANRQNGYMVARIREIHWPQDDLNDQYRFRKELIDIGNAHTRVGDILYSEMIATILDNRYGFLYILMNNALSQTMECAVVFVDAPFGSIVGTFVHIGRFDVHSNNYRRLLWSQDPYTEKVYYAESSADHSGMLVYSVEMRNLMATLIDGEAGSLERVLSGSRSYLSVSNGIAISYSDTHGVLKQFIHRLNETSDVILCEHGTDRSQLDGGVQLALLFNEDFCRVREGRSTVTQCEEEEELVLDNTPHTTQPQWSNESNLSGDQFSTSILFWLIPLIVLCVVVVLLLLYIIKQRRHASRSMSVYKDDRPHVHYYPSFIADSSVDF